MGKPWGYPNGTGMGTARHAQDDAATFPLNNVPAKRAQSVLSPTERETDTASKGATPPPAPTRGKNEIITYTHSVSFNLLSVP